MAYEGKMIIMSKNWDLENIRKIAKTLNVDYKQACEYYGRMRAISPEHAYSRTITYMYNIQRAK